MLPSPRPTPPCCWSGSALLSLANTRVLFPTARGQTLWEDTWNETPQHHIEQVESGKEPAANHSEANLHFSLPLLHGSRLFTCSHRQVSQEGALILLQAQHPCLPMAVSKGNVVSKVGQECAPASVPGDPETPSSCTLAPQVWVSHGPRGLVCFYLYVLVPPSKTPAS